CMEALEFPYSF
nr:immunoglobulin light chain junction region [Macaca mulatta]MOV82801.1 immunoglobulin light chain junction region [Macaca mulatta]MOV84832.1 immunoglobulin light chain junction region [Macaca mulatta]MOV86457.1 immunoglobulin light chain junction region [Macaca mulatta]MOW51718.1 immunoglobulin light chain junction region [Macaca mulatta]